MHEPLTDPLVLDVPGVMAGGMIRKQRVHAAVPVAHALAVEAPVFILDVETPAGGANEGAGAAVKAGKGHVIPERGAVQRHQILIFEVVRFNGGDYFCLGSRLPCFFV